MEPDPQAFKAGSGATLRDPNLRANYRRATRGLRDKRREPVRCNWSADI